jgi:hypothetical protein
LDGSIVVAIVALIVVFCGVVTFARRNHKKADGQGGIGVLKEPLIELAEGKSVSSEEKEVIERSVRDLYASSQEEEKEILESLVHASDRPISLMHVGALVIGRLRRVQKLFPSASHSDLCEVMLTYSPESALFAKGHTSTEPFTETKWAKFEGKLSYGCEQSFHDGVVEILGVEQSFRDDSDAMDAMRDEIIRDGTDNDRYNLWYVGYCAAVEQVIRDEGGQPRKDARGGSKVLDEGHGGMRLRDFTSKINQMLQHAGSLKRVTDANMLALRLYTSSTFRQFNTSLRNKGLGSSRLWRKVANSVTTSKMPFRVCVQNARQCVLSMQAIKRAHKNTFRGATGFLGNEFKGNGMVGVPYPCLPAPCPH